MRFPNVVATILVLMVIIAGALALADQIALIRIQRAVELSVGEFRP